MLIEFIVLFLTFVAIIMIMGIIAEFFKPFDIFVKSVVVKIYIFGKSTGKSIKNIISDRGKNE